MNSEAKDDINLADSIAHRWYCPQVKAARKKQAD